MAENRVTALGAEVLRTGGAKARVTMLGAEVLRTGGAKARVTMLAAEVLRSTADGAGPPPPGTGKRPIVCIVC